MLNNFIFTRLKFEATKKPRKIRGLFGSAFDGTKTQEYSAEKCVKLFRTMIFAIRSKVNPTAPIGWTINSETNLEWFGELITKKTSVLDQFLDD